MLKKRLFQNFDLVTGKNERRRGPRCPLIFGHIKEDTRTFNFR